MKRVRCAIYTRKSSEEGLEQDFNSLHAQREACAAYVLSQASEGWILNADEYDDGGISGGTLIRPALQRLLADIAEGKIDIIVVYKVDRLTRSLLDFSKLVEAFDKAGVSFVSITQSFNTTTSMGRLTLNMLLSFAQFEREVTAERIRDKIAASKAKGMWMGGVEPAGYRKDGRTLRIVEEEAQLVRHIYARYLALGNVRSLAEELAGQGRLSPVRIYVSGRRAGGNAFSRGQLYCLLSNPIYTGRIRHRDKTYPGQHAGIIDAETWDAVQAQLADNTQGNARQRGANRSLLAGLVRDEAGEPLIASHACKGKVRYRYYISPAAQSGDGSDAASTRIPAKELETAVIERVAQALDDPLALIASLGLPLDPADIRKASAAAVALAAKVRDKDAANVRALVAAVTVQRGEIVIDLDGCHLAEVLGLGAPVQDIVTVTASVRLTRTGRAMRLIHGDGRSAGQEPNESLLKLVLRGRAYWARLERGEADCAAIADQDSVTSSYVTRVMRLAFLSPRVVEAIVAGEQPASLGTKLLLATGFPASWAEQERLFLSR